MIEKNSKTPIIIKIFSIMNYISSIIGIIVIFFLFLSKSLFGLALALVFMILFIIDFLVARGLWTGQPWSFYALLIGLLSGAITSIVNTYKGNLGVIGLILSLIIFALIIAYLIYNDKVLKHFGLENESPVELIKDFWNFLKEDSWQSWLVSIILIVVGIKFIFFPLMSLVTGTALPLVVVESCSMYHESSLSNWWDQNSLWYESEGITRSEFESFSFKNGLNKGDIMLVWGYSKYQKGDVMIFKAPTKYPIIHRIVSLEPLSTKGDHNYAQITGIETDIEQDSIIGKAVAKIPYLGWIKLIFFEPFKNPDQRGLCK